MRPAARVQDREETLVDVLRDCACDRAVLVFIQSVRDRERVPDPIREKLRERLARRAMGPDVESDVELAVRVLCRNT
jgi:hypothetical protein